MSIDGRGRVARYFRRLSDAVVADVGRELSVVEKEQVSMAVHLLLRSQSESNPGTAIRLASESRRLLESLRARSAKNRPAGPSLHEYLATKYGTSTTTEDAEEENMAEAEEA